ncbi:LAFE_0D02828g1_1 [Lachancea fermentati]|uniref:LAFE_0D02828g1_1 n=1 Tax=Lachancea fermentati TaxID=4955 RepID=A0A1G4MAU4_LACFM|nr:LAFE_0D02828g1_1 [Lachancea fermentati]
MANLLLQDPFSVLKEFPEKLSQVIETPLQSSCVKFSLYGDYLAVGCSNGAIIIYDMDTGNPITMLGNRGGSHVRSIQSLDWSSSGRYLVSSSRDWYVKVWDLRSPGHPLKQMKFNSPLWNCRWNNLNPWQCIATAFEQTNALLIDFQHDIPSFKKLCCIEENANSGDYGHTLVFCIHPRYQNLILTGTSKGWIKFYKMNNDGIFLIQQEKFANSNAKHMIISQAGDKIAVNSSDRTIRQYSLEVSSDLSVIRLSLEHKYQDVINKLQWNSIFFSNNSAEYLVASTHGSSAHELYLWETNTGTLVRVLEGPEEELLDIDWNFYSMCIASNGLETGNVYVWSIVIPPKWSALAPDFEEIEENVEYQEKEDEFDQVDELEQQQELDQAEEVLIDLKTKEDFDVRGNDLTLPRFIIPINYEDILMIKRWERL